MFAVWEDERGARRVPRGLAGRRALARARPRSATRCGSRRCAGTAPGAVAIRWPAPRRRPAARRAGRRSSPARAIRPPRRRRAFYRAIARPRATLLDAARAARVGRRSGEWPLARQATFSLWRCARRRDAPTRTGREPIATSSGAPARSAGTREELFARFRPYGSMGTWDGRDPLHA